MSELHRSELMSETSELNCKLLWDAAEKEAEARNLAWIDAVAALELATEKEGRANFAAWASKEEAAWCKSEWEKAKNAQ